MDRSRFATGAALDAVVPARQSPNGQASHVATFLPLRRNIRSRDIELWQQVNGTFTLRFAGSTQCWSNPALPRGADGARQFFWHDHDSAVSYVDQVYGGFGGLRVVPVGNGT